MLSLATLSRLLALTPVAVFALPQYGGGEGSNHHVIVGGPGKLLFDPEAIAARIGDTVTFEFRQKNHTVTQSSLAAPCSPLEYGYNTGFHPVAEGQTDGFPTETYTVQEDRPLWFYCAQTAPAPHCHKGMVFSINCGPDGAPNSLAEFKKAALALDTSAPAPPQTTPPPAPPSNNDGEYDYSGPGETYTNADGEWYTIPPAPEVITVTQTVTHGQEVWTTTYGSYPNSPDPTPNPEPRIIEVIVGGPGRLAYEPSAIVAKPRDIIRFSFRQKNHTVTQSTFADPCRRRELTTGVAGFDSGFQPVPEAMTDGFPTWDLVINDTQPTWAYCRQTAHCGQGMVLSINADETSERNTENFRALAIKINGTTVQNNQPSGSASGSAPPAPSGSAPAGNGAVAGVSDAKVVAGVLGLVGAAFAMLF